MTSVGVHEQTATLASRGGVRLHYHCGLGYRGRRHWGSGDHSGVINNKNNCGDLEPNKWYWHLLIVSDANKKGF